MTKPTFLILTSKWPYESKTSDRIFAPQPHLRLQNKLWIRRRRISYVNVHLYGGFNSVDNIAQTLGCGLYDRWIMEWLPADVRDIPSPKRPQWLWGPTQHPCGLFPDSQAAKRWVEQSPLSNAEVKSEWTHNFFPPYAFTACPNGWTQTLSY
jgi:hypothetical protein